MILCRAGSSWFMSSDADASLLQRDKDVVEFYTAAACQLADSYGRCALRYNCVKHPRRDLSFQGPVNDGLGKADRKSGRIPSLSLGHYSVTRHHQEVSQPFKLKRPTRHHHLGRRYLFLRTWQEPNRRMEVDKRFNFVPSFSAQGVHKHPRIAFQANDSARMNNG